jgi:hypothetical protein
MPKRNDVDDDDNFVVSLVKTLFGLFFLYATIMLFQGGFRVLKRFNDAFNDVLYEPYANCARDVSLCGALSHYERKACFEGAKMLFQGQDLCDAYVRHTTKNFTDVSVLSREGVLSRRSLDYVNARRIGVTDTARLISVLNVQFAKRGGQALDLRASDVFDLLEFEHGHDDVTAQELLIYFRTLWNEAWRVSVSEDDAAFRFELVVA